MYDIGVFDKQAADDYMVVDIDGKRISTSKWETTPIREPILLEYGKKYRFEAFYEEFEGDSHVALKWKTAAMSTPQTIPHSAFRRT